MAKRRADGYLRKTFTVKGKKYYVYGKTREELRIKEERKRAELERGIETHDNPTVSEYCDRWMQNRRGKRGESTIRTQSRIMDVLMKVEIKGLSNSFGNIKLKEVTIDDLRNVQEELKKSRKSQTVNDYMSLLKHVFSDALKERKIDYDPCGLLENLKRTEEAARDTIHRALSLEEQRLFFGCERCKKSYYYNVFRFAIATGMRAGEIGALRYSDIINDMIHVERTITRTELGNYVVGQDAKTEAGRRIIPVNDQIREILADQKTLNEMMNETMEKNVISINELIFKAPERGLLMATSIDREIKRICKTVGIEPFTMHGFRDTFATRCIENGMNPKTLQELLGHADFSLTMSLYAHCLPQTKKAEMESLFIAI